MSGGVGSPPIKPAQPEPQQTGLKHLRGDIWVDAEGRWHNLQPTPCYLCGGRGRYCLLCGRP